MIAADNPDRRSAKLLTVDGGRPHAPFAARRARIAVPPRRPGRRQRRRNLAGQPAAARICASGEPIEVRLAGWVSIGDPTRFVAIAFGAGDHRTRTEDRAPPPALSPGDRLSARAACRGRRASCSAILALSSCASWAAARMCWPGWRDTGGRSSTRMSREPLALWDVWTTIAADPVAFEPPSAGFALDWRTLQAWRRRGVGFATLTHAAGISSTGDPMLDLRLALRRALSHPCSDRGGDRPRRRRKAGASSRSARPSCARSRPPPAADGSVRAGDGVAQRTHRA